MDWIVGGISYPMPSEIRNVRRDLLRVHEVDIDNNLSGYARGSAKYQLQAFWKRLPGAQAKALLDALVNAPRGLACTLCIDSDVPYAGTFALVGEPAYRPRPVAGKGWVWFDIALDLREV